MYRLNLETLPRLIQSDSSTHPMSFMITEPSSSSLRQELTGACPLVGLGELSFLSHLILTLKNNCLDHSQHFCSQKIYSLFLEVLYNGKACATAVHNFVINRHHQYVQGETPGSIEFF